MDKRTIFYILGTLILSGIAGIARAQGMIVPDPGLNAAIRSALSQPVKLETGALQFTFRNTPGLGFTVLSTSDLSLPLNAWASAGPASEVSPGHYQFTDATAAPTRFYTVRSQ
jgi:hypothetical protein